jgi:hypothetical protein
VNSSASEKDQEELINEILKNINNFSNKEMDSDSENG